MSPPTLRRLLLVATASLAACGPWTAGDATADAEPQTGAVDTAGATTLPAAPPATAIDSARLLRDLHVLAHDSMEGRAVGTAGNARARAFLERRFAGIGLEPAGREGYAAPFRFTRRQTTVEGVNMVGMVRGSARPDRYIVVTAHYDHLGVRDGEVFNGADDNASGSAGLLAIAEHFARERPRHSMIFAAFDAEEVGLRGARAFVADPPVPAEALVLNVNLDMVGRNDRGELYVAGTHHYPQLRPWVEHVAARAPVTLVPGHDTPDPTPGDDWTLASDHGAFHEAGIPFLYFGVEDHADYHRPTDAPERIQAAFFVRAVRTVLDALQVIDAGFTSMN